MTLALMSTSFVSPGEIDMVPVPALISSKATLPRRSAALMKVPFLGARYVNPTIIFPGVRESAILPPVPAPSQLQPVLVLTR